MQKVCEDDFMSGHHHRERKAILHGISFSLVSYLEATLWVTVDILSFTSGDRGLA